MPGYQDPFMGGQPQMGPQGQQGPPMGGGMPPMGGGQQGPPPPMQGPPQQGPGMGGPPMGGQAPPTFGGNYGQPMMNSAPQGPPPEMQEAINNLQWQLMQAQNGGAPPNVIGDLQMQLMQAQQAFQVAGMKALYERQVNEPMRGGSVGQSNSRHGGGGGAGGMSRSGQAASQNYGLGTDLLAQLWGLGGGGGYGQIG